MVANEFVGLAEAVGEGAAREELVGAFVGLLKDNEAEVRTAGAGQIPGKPAFLKREETDRIQALPSLSIGKSSLHGSCHASGIFRPTRANMSVPLWLRRSPALPRCLAGMRLRNTSSRCSSSCSRMTSARYG